MTTTANPFAITLDLATVRSFLAECLAEKGADYVYTPKNVDECSYLDYDEDGQPTGPSCLVGHVLVKAGVPLEEIKPLEGNAADRAIDTLDLDADEYVVLGLQMAQEAQDSKKPWGEAVAAFEKEIRL